MSENNPNSSVEWAYIFSTFGMDDLREILYKLAYGLRETEKDREVVEFAVNEDDEGNEKYSALPITDHVESLEDELDVDNEIEQQFGVTD